MSGTSLEEGWHAIDLHVHTPASKDYRGKKDDEEYKSILKQAVDYTTDDKEPDNGTKLKLIAITDHNTVDGFKSILRVKQETSNLIKMLSNRNPGHEIIKELREEESLFNNIHVLMGIEIKTYPGVHILAVFHESVLPEEVEAFLSEGLEGNFGVLKGDPEPMLKWNIPQTFNELEKYFQHKCFIIAPHVDSNYGLYEALKNLPPARVEAFKHHMLKGISFNSIENRDRIRLMLQGQDYKRKSPLAFIQSSDFHGQKGYEIGFMHTKLNFGQKKINYNSISELLNNDSNVKCSADTVADTYMKLIKNKDILKINSSEDNRLTIRKDDYNNLSEYVCAFYNTNGGIVDISGNVKSEIDKTDILKNLEEQLGEILSERIKQEKFTFGMRTLQMSNSKYKALIRFDRSKKLNMSEGVVYTIKDGKPVPATANEIEFIVTTNLQNKYIINAENSLNQLSYEAKRLAEAQISYPILAKCDSNYQNRFKKLFDYKLLDINEPIDELERLTNKHVNGTPNGNLEVSISKTPTRFKDSYVRFTVPTFNVDMSKIEINKHAIFNEKGGILIVFGGGIYISNAKKHLHITRPTFCISKKSDETNLNIMAAWFKSSYFIWHCLTVLGAEDMFQLLMQRERKIPILKEENINNIKFEVDNYLNNILIEEDKILREINKLEDKKEDKKNIENAIMKHNKMINGICFEIDILFLKSLNITEGQAISIYKALDNLDIYDFGVSENKEQKDKLAKL